jgi:hypothetical protein
MTVGGASAVGPATRTRFAPAPTGYLHLGHVANAIHVWDAARSAGAVVLLRIEDHDRVRSRPEYDAAILEDLAWLGFEPDEGPVRQSDADAQKAYPAAVERLRADGRRAHTATAPLDVLGLSAAHGCPWTGIGCPGGAASVARGRCSASPWGRV